jgi:hypothetical protein
MLNHFGREVVDEQNGDQPLVIRAIRWLIITTEGRLSIGRSHVVFGVVYILFLIGVAVFSSIQVAKLNSQIEAASRTEVELRDYLQQNKTLLEATRIDKGLRDISKFAAGLRKRLEEIEAASGWPFTMACLTNAIILLTGAIALMLEARLVRMPATLRAWSNRSRPMRGSVSQGGGELPASRAAERLQTRGTQTFWSLAGEYGAPDVAVIQLLFGCILVAIIQLIALAYRVSTFADYGLRLLTITIASEVVYLAFLGARVIKVDELADIVREIRRLQLERRHLLDLELRGAKKSQSIRKNKAAVGVDERSKIRENSQEPMKEISSKLKEIDDAIEPLEVRADFLWLQLGFIFESTASGAP